MIRDLSPDALKALLDKVEAALSSVERPTKKIVLKTVADEGHCSAKSTGIESSLLKVLQAKQISLTPKFAALMGAKAGATAATTASRPAVPTGEEKEGKPEEQAHSRINLKGVSLINFNKQGGATVTFLDGESESVGKLDESVLRSSCNLIEFNA